MSADTTGGEGLRGTRAPHDTAITATQDRHGYVEKHVRHRAVVKPRHSFDTGHHRSKHKARGGQTTAMHGSSQIHRSSTRNDRSSSGHGSGARLHGSRQLHGCTRQHGSMAQHGSLTRQHSPTRIAARRYRSSPAQEHLDYRSPGGNENKPRRSEMNRRSQCRHDYSVYGDRYHSPRGERHRYSRKESYYSSTSESSYSPTEAHSSEGKVESSRFSPRPGASQSGKFEDVLKWTKNVFTGSTVEAIQETDSLRCLLHATSTKEPAKQAEKLAWAPLSKKLPDTLMMVAKGKTSIPGSKKMKVFKSGELLPHGEDSSNPYSVGIPDYNFCKRNLPPNWNLLVGANADQPSATLTPTDLDNLEVSFKRIRAVSSFIEWETAVAHDLLEHKGPDSVKQAMTTLQTVGTAISQLVKDVTTAETNVILKKRDAAIKVIPNILPEANKLQLRHSEIHPKYIFSSAAVEKSHKTLQSAMEDEINWKLAYNSETDQASSSVSTTCTRTYSSDSPSSSSEDTHCTEDVDSGNSETEQAYPSVSSVYYSDTPGSSSSEATYYAEETDFCNSETEQPSHSASNVYFSDTSYTCTHSETAEDSYNSDSPSATAVSSSE